MQRDRKPRRVPPGIRVRHSRGCSVISGKRCSCRPSYEAFAFDRRTGRKVRRTFRSLAEAKSWRRDAQQALEAGTITSERTPRLREAALALVAGMRDGAIRTSSGERYKPSAIRSYDESLRLHVLPELGDVRLADLRRSHVVRLAKSLLADRSEGTVRNALVPLRVIYREAIERGDVALSPLSDVKLPSSKGRRDRIASPQEAAALIAALPERDRALWATAFYAGLRRGELQALRWRDIDFDANVIHVLRSWDASERRDVGPKSKAGTRVVPMPEVLRARLRAPLAAHKLASPHSGSDALVFAQDRDADSPFSAGAVQKRADRAWAGRERITLHEARHTYASIAIAAGVNVKALSAYMGHSSVQTTLDRYGHLMPGNEREAADRLDAYLSGGVAR